VIVASVSAITAWVTPSVPPAARYGERRRGARPRCYLLEALIVGVHYHSTTQAFARGTSGF